MTCTTLPSLTCSSTLQPQPQKGQTVSTAVVTPMRASTRLSLSIRAPVGQAETQLPHISHDVSTMERPNEVDTSASKPRSAKSSTLHCCTSRHTETQRPQRMQRLGS